MDRREFVRTLCVGSLGGSLAFVGRGAAEGRSADGAQQGVSDSSAGDTTADTRDSPSQSGSDAGGSFADRNRELIVGGVAVAALAALALLAYALRPGEGDTADGEHRRYERGNLLDGGEPRNLLEWTVKAGNRPRSYAVMLAAAVGGWIALTLTGFPGVGAAFLFGAVLLVMQWFLRFCWPYIESFHEGEQSQSDPESIRFEGFSTDSKVFLTLLAVLFLVFMGLILVGEVV